MPTAEGMRASVSGATRHSLVVFWCSTLTSGMLALWHVVETGVFIVESWAASVSAHATTALTRRGLPKGLQVDAG